MPSIWCSSKFYLLEKSWGKSSISAKIPLELHVPHCSIFQWLWRKLFKTWWWKPEEEKNFGSQFFHFSLAVFGENPRYCYSFGIIIVVMQKLRNFVIFLLLLKILIWNSECAFTIQSNPYYQGRQFKMHIFQNYALFLTKKNVDIL